MFFDIATILIYSNNLNMSRQIYSFIHIFVGFWGRCQSRLLKSQLCESFKLRLYIVLLIWFSTNMNIDLVGAEQAVCFRLVLTNNRVLVRKFGITECMFQNAVNYRFTHLLTQFNMFLQHGTTRYTKCTPSVGRTACFKYQQLWQFQI